MTAEKKLMYGLDPSKYPSRMGQPWKEDEVVKLLTSIQRKKSIEEIAKEHDRTEGSIHSYIRKLAVDYHFNDNRPMEEIQKFTGLTKELIEDAIQKRTIKDAIEKSSETARPKAAKKKSKTCEGPTMLEVVSILKDIQCKLNALLEKVA